MRWIAIVALVFIGCGSVDNANGQADGDGATGNAGGGVPCPTEDYTTPEPCHEIDLYGVSAASNVNEQLVSESVQGTCTQSVGRCLSVRVVANGNVSADGLCTYTRTEIDTDQVGDCMATIVNRGTVPLATLQANAGPGHPTH